MDQVYVVHSLWGLEKLSVSKEGSMVSYTHLLCRLTLCTCLENMMNRRHHDLRTYLCYADQLTFLEIVIDIP